jgi:hypothetical protein
MENRSFILVKRVLALIALLSVSLIARGDRLCFSFAQTYYEQLYCEIKAKGKGANLPVFYEFQRNNVQTQALLLKASARSIGIDLKMPVMGKRAIKKLKMKPKGTSVNKIEKRSENESSTQSTVNESITRCTVDKTTIRCPGQSYHLIGNQPNNQLSKLAFSSDNKMDMPAYQGRRTDNEAIDRYLERVYRLYLNKMLYIGLGGATLSYGKFSYLFDDLLDKSISFSERFETMYYYLKQDKQRMAVNTRVVAPKPLILNDCYELVNLYVCTLGAKNYLFLPPTSP